MRISKQVSRLAMVVAGLYATQANAQQQPAATPIDGTETGRVEDIVVTARRVSENLQSTPVAITALTSQTLETRNVVTLEKMSSLAPNLSITQTFGFVGAINPFIRGIGQGEVQYGQDSPIGIYIDGVYNGRTNNARFELVELERIEVLRGPQGTLFGRNTSGGAISITTRSPSDDPGGEAKLSYGNYGSAAARLRVDTGLLGNSSLKATIAYQHRQNHGYVDNVFVSSDRDYGASKNDAVWAKIVGEWGPVSISVSGDYSDQRAYHMLAEGVAAGTNLTNFFNRSPTASGEIYQVNPKYISSTDTDAPPSRQHVKTRGIGFTGQVELTDWLTAKSITAWRGFTFNGGQPTGPNSLTGLIGAAPALAVVRTVPSVLTITGRDQKQSQFSEELQLLGDLGDVHFVIGGFYYRENARDMSTLATLVPLASTALLVTTQTDYSIRNRSKAGFGQASWKPAFAGDRLEISGGIRYTKDDKNVVQLASVARTARTAPDNTSYLASISYKWVPGFMTYARYATGYRAGGFNTRATGTTPFTYLPETTKSAEVGFKADMFDRRLRLNAAVYQADSSDLQVSQFGALTSQQLNANARYRGFEVEVTAVPTDGLTLTSSIGHVDPEYKRFIVGLPATSAVPPALGPQDPALRALGLVDAYRIGEFNYVPHWTGSAGINYQLPRASYGQWSVHADYSYVGTVHFLPTNLANLNPLADTVIAKHYGLVSGRVALSEIEIGGGSMQISVFAENIFNKRYRVSGVDYGASVGYATVSWGRPATVGGEIKVAF